MKTIMIRALILLLPFARVGSGDFLDTGVWEQGDNPGAGSQDFTVLTDTGVNGNWKRMWKCLTTFFGSSGVPKQDSIPSGAMVAGYVDGTSILSTGTSSKVISVKDLGVTTAKINDLAVTTGKIAAKAVTSTELANDASVDANRAVQTNHIRDAAVTATKIAANGVLKTNLSQTLLQYFLFGDARLAGLAAGNTPAATNEWTETFNGVVRKISLIYQHNTNDKSINVIANAKTSSAGTPWKVQIDLTAIVQTGTSISGSVQGANTTYATGAGGTAEAAISLNVVDTAVSPSGLYELTISLGTVGGTQTASMKNLVIMVERG